MTTILIRQFDVIYIYVPFLFTRRSATNTVHIVTAPNTIVKEHKAPNIAPSVASVNSEGLVVTSSTIPVLERTSLSGFDVTAMVVVGHEYD